MEKRWQRRINDLMMANSKDATFRPTHQHSQQNKNGYDRAIDDVLEVALAADHAETLMGEVNVKLRGVAQDIVSVQELTSPFTESDPGTEADATAAMSRS